MRGEAPALTEIASRTDVGLQRGQNQDACGSWVDAGGRQLLLVADGMGGHQGGATASRMAVDVIGQCFEQRADEPAEALLRGAFEAANRAIHGAARCDPALAGMGTTAVALLLEAGDGAGRAVVAHVGDSRLYRLRRGRLERLTRDHSVAGEAMARRGLSAQDAAALPDAHALLRALGPHAQLEPEIQALAVEPGDVFLLCTDGLWGLRPDEAIAAVLGQYRPADAARLLIDEANRFGGSDNITVLIAAVAEVAASRAAAGVTSAVSARRARRPRVRGPSVKGALAASALAAGALAAAALLLLLRLDEPPAAGEAAPPPPLAAATDAAPAGGPHAPGPREEPSVSAALLMGLRQNFAAYERALRSCDLGSLEGAAGESVLLRARRRCAERPASDVSVSIGEASLRPLDGGRYAIDVEERDGGRRSELRAVLRLQPGGAWQIADLVPRERRTPERAAAPAHGP